MNQRIFSLNLSVETTSAYLACCGLADEKEFLTYDSIKSVWNGTEESLKKSLSELESMNIIKMFKDDDGLRYSINEENSWSV